MIRRLFLSAVFAASSLTALSVTAQSFRGWPLRTVRIVVAAPAGSSVDVVARTMVEGAGGLRERWGQAVVIDNKPAAGGTAAATDVAKAAPDGHTLLLGFNGPLATAPSLYSTLGAC